MKMIRDLVNQAIKGLGLPVVEFSVEHPKNESHGDYSCNIAMVAGSGSPRELAEKLVEQIYKDRNFVKTFEKVEVAGPGFINFYLKQEFLAEEVTKATQSGYGKNDNLKGQKTFVEYTDPNPFKEFHIGHLMSNTIGESLARILEANGAEVRRANYQGDVGLHVAKAIYGLLFKIQNPKSKITNKSRISKSQIQNWIEEWQNKNLLERQKMMGDAYAYGATQYEIDENAKAEMQSLNKEIYEGLVQPARPGLAGVMDMYQAGREWSLAYFETIYARLGTKFDEYFFESEAGPVGLKVVEEGLEKGVLEVGEEGAVIFPGEKYGLHTRVFRNKLGLPTYEAKDLGLAKTKWERWQYDRSYIVTANEIDEYFKVLLKTLSLLYPELSAKTTHLSHGMMKLKSGKMSSRTGKVVTGEGLLDELKEVVLAKMGDPSSPKATNGQRRKIKNREKVADQIAVGALKYSVLKQAVGGDIVYEPDKITNLEGDTGPYIQYTYVRALSVLNKFQAPNSKLQTNSNDINLKTEELAIMRWIYRYGEVVMAAGEKYSPHMVAGYVYELATRFNTFYNQHQIVGSEFRLLLTQAVAETLRSGLGLLGIEAPEEM